MNPTTPDDAFDRLLHRFLEVRAEELASATSRVGVLDALVANRTAAQRVDRRSVLVLGAMLLLGLVFVVAAVGALYNTHRRPITAIPGGLSWAPDGSALAFSVSVEEHRTTPADSVGGVPPPDRFVDTWVVTANGTNPRRLSREALPPGSFWAGSAPMWSPDSRFVAYSLAPGSSPADGRIAIQAVTGSSAAVKTLGQPVAWSPVEDRLLIDRADASGTDIFTMSVDASDIRQLTSSHDAVASGWLPDGSRIVYERGVDTTTTWVVAKDGSANQQVAAFGHAGWAPDGSAIYYITSSPGDLRAVAPDGSNDRLVETSFVWSGWTWAPGGSASVQSTDTGLFVGAPGVPGRRLTGDFNDVLPSWSPDGAVIAFVGTRPEGSGLFVIPSSGGTPRLIGGGALESGGYAWQPGTRRLSFVRDFSIQLVDADGSAPDTLVPAAAVGDTNGDVATGVGFQTRMTIDNGGPDRAIYRVPLAPGFSFTIQNRTNDPWIIGLQGLDVFPTDCVTPAQGAMVLVSSRKPSAETGPRLATPPDYCLIGPRATIVVTKQFVTHGAYLAALAHSGQAVGAFDSGYYSFVLDFEATP